MIAVLTACVLTCSFAPHREATPSAPPQQAPRAERQTRTPSALGLQGYSVVLVVGDMQSASGADSVPPAARKALNDMQAFLPYKRYQLLDAGWMLCCGSYRDAITGRLRGPEEREYAYAIETMSGEDGKLTVRFTLRETAASAASATPSPASSASAGARGGGGARGASPQSPMSDSARAEYSRQLYEVAKEREEAEIQLRRIRQNFEVGVSTKTELDSATARYLAARTRADEIERTLQPVRAGSVSTYRASLLDSTFSIAIGETVVIGTSRLKGDQALIALLTAATKTGATR